MPPMADRSPSPPRRRAISSSPLGSVSRSLAQAHPSQPGLRSPSSPHGVAASISIATARSRPSKNWLWCTAAGVQIVRNIVDGQEDHTTSRQRRYFTWMREHNRYTLPLSAGVDPQGWTAGLRHFVDDRYRLVASTTFENALRSAVKRLRLTNLPVALAVAHGSHGWILTGFTATADPAITASFQVTSVRVTGPLFGLQSRTATTGRPTRSSHPRSSCAISRRGVMRPDDDLGGRYVSIQPVP